MNNNNLCSPTVLAKPSDKAGGSDTKMSFFEWANLGMDTVEVAALIVVLMLLYRVHRNISALLRVIRRMDRKTADTTISRYRRQAEVNEAALQWTGDREQHLDRPTAD